MSEPFEADPQVPDPEDESAPLMAAQPLAGRLSREELVAHLKETLSQRIEPTVEQRQPSAATEASPLPDTATSDSPEDVEELPGSQADHSHVMEMMGSSAWKKRLEEARAQRQKVLASAPVARRTPGDDQGSRDLAVAWSTIPSATDDDEPAMPLSGLPIQQFGGGPMGHLERSVLLSKPSRPGWRPHWALSLTIGLVSGLAAGAGLMWLGASETPYLFGALDPTERPGPSESAALPSENAEPASISVSPAFWDAGPPAPIILDGPYAAYIQVPVGFDRPPGRPMPGRLDEPRVADSLEVTTADAGVPDDAGQWLPSPLLAPGLGDDVERLEDLPTEVLPPRSAQALARPSPSDPQSVPAAAQVAEAAPLGVTGVTQTFANTPADLPRHVVALHLSPDLPQESIEEARTVLRTEGFDLTSSSAASNSFARSQVFFFHQDDAPAAERLAQAIGAQVRDFSAYRPSPELGRLEVWLAQDG